MAPSLHGRYPASPLLRANPPPSRLSTDFPVSPVIRPTLLHHFPGGTRRASPVAQRVLVTEPPLPPRRSEPAASVRFRLPILPSPYRRRLGLRGKVLFRGHLCVRLRCGPVTCSPPYKMALSMSFRKALFLLSVIQATGLLTTTQAGLTPAERASLSRTHDDVRTFWCEPSEDVMSGLHRLKLTIAHLFCR